jgi:hypothetical protein
MVIRVWLSLTYDQYTYLIGCRDEAASIGYAVDLVAHGLIQACAPAVVAGRSILRRKGPSEHNVFEWEYRL